MWCCRTGPTPPWPISAARQFDDGSDTTKAVTNTKKLISEDKVDVIVGSTITPNSLAMVDVVADAETPMISMAASSRIVDPANPKTKWVFKTPQSDSLMADAIAINMKANGVKTMGYIGFADGYGDGWTYEVQGAPFGRTDFDIDSGADGKVVSTPGAPCTGAST